MLYIGSRWTDGLDANRTLNVSFEYDLIAMIEDPWHADSGTITIEFEGCSFMSNGYEEHNVIGTVFVDDPFGIATVHVSDAQFERNEAKVGVSLVHLSAYNYDRSPIELAYNKHDEVKNCSFHNNTASDVGNIVVYNTDLNFHHSNCTHNFAGLDGACIVTYSSTLEMSNVYIENSTTQISGTIYADFSIVRVYATKFTSNQAYYGDGACIYAKRMMPLILGQCPIYTFESNYENFTGNGSYLFDINECYFEDNVAHYGSGGAIYIGTDYDVDYIETNETAPTCLEYADRRRRRRLIDSDSFYSDNLVEHHFGMDLTDDLEVDSFGMDLRSQSDGQSHLKSDFDFDFDFDFDSDFERRRLGAFDTTDFDFDLLSTDYDGFGTSEEDEDSVPTEEPTNQPTGDPTAPAECLHVDVKTDVHFDDITWSVQGMDTDGTVDWTESGTGRPPKCIENTNNKTCFEFTLEDSFGDGLMYGLGTWEIHLYGDWWESQSQGDYHDDETLQFCGSWGYDDETPVDINLTVSIINDGSLNLVEGFLDYLMPEFEYRIAPKLIFTNIASLDETLNEITTYWEQSSYDSYCPGYGISEGTPCSEDGWAAVIDALAVQCMLESTEVDDDYYLYNLSDFWGDEDRTEDEVCCLNHFE